METLANILECSTATVSRAIRTCEYAGLVEIHEIQTRNNRTRFSYTLKAGLLANWMPTPKPYRGKLTVADHRLKLMTDYQNRIAELEALLEGAVNPETGEFIVSQKRNNVAEVVESGFATNEGKEEEVANSKKRLNHVLLRFPYFQPRMYLEATVSTLTLHRTSSAANMSAMQ